LWSAYERTFTSKIAPILGAHKKLRIPQQTRHPFQSQNHHLFRYKPATDSNRHHLEYKVGQQYKSQSLRFRLAAISISGRTIKGKITRSMVCWVPGTERRREALRPSGFRPKPPLTGNRILSAASVRFTAVNFEE